MTPTQLIIDSKFNGPPKSGNGGYSCGILGQFIDGPAEVMLRVPPPLDKEMQVETRDGKLFLMDGETIVAEGKAKGFEVNLPAPISYEEAVSASAKYIGFSDHHFGSCFVCGPDRSVHDGLRIFSGATQQTDIVAAPWEPFDDLFDESLQLKKEYYWSAMDCPSYFAIVGEQMSVLLLGKMACHIVNPIHQGEKIVVMAWKIGEEGRKFYSGTVLYGTDGELKSYSKNVWIALKKEQAEKMIVK